MGLIAFEGEMLDSDQLEAKRKEVEKEHSQKKREISELLQAAAKLQDVIDDMFWDRVLTGAQMVLGVACIIFAPIMAPMVGLITIGADIVLEVVKWGVIDDFSTSWDDVKGHLLTIGLDIVFIGVSLLFNKFLGKVAVRTLQKEVSAVEKEIRQTTEQAEIALNEAERRAVIAGNAEASAAEKAAKEAREAATKARTEASNAEAKMKDAEAALDKEIAKGAENSEKVNLLLTQYNTAYENYFKLDINALSLGEDAAKMERKAGEAISKALQSESERLNARLKLTKTTIADKNMLEGIQRLEALQQQSQKWLYISQHPLQMPNVPVASGNAFAKYIKSLLGVEATFDFAKTISMMNQKYVPNAVKWFRRGILVEVPLLGIEKNYLFVRSFSYWMNDILNYVNKDRKSLPTTEEALETAELNELKNGTT